MSTPKFLDCNTAADIASTEQLLQHAEGGPLVLRFASLGTSECAALLDKLGHELVDHTVFQSRFSADGPWITVLPVVTRATILAHCLQIQAAITAYVRTSAELVQQYQTSTLPGDWSADDDGEHCEFEHSISGQIVKTPLYKIAQIQRIDPYFWALFVKSTVGQEAVAGLITHDFHDAARILESMTANAPDIQESSKT